MWQNNIPQSLGELYFSIITHFFLSLLWVVTKIIVFSPSSTRWVIYGQFFFIQNHLSNSLFSFPFIEISDLHIYFVFILWFRHLSATLVCSSSLCGIVSLSCFVHAFVRFRLPDQLWSGADPINDFSVCTLSFYAINMDVVSLFADSSFLFLMYLHCINVLYRFEWMNIISFYKKKNWILKFVRVFFTGNLWGYFRIHKSFCSFFLLVAGV